MGELVMGIGLVLNILGDINMDALVGLDIREMASFVVSNEYAPLEWVLK